MIKLRSVYAWINGDFDDEEFFFAISKKIWEISVGRTGFSRIKGKPIGLDRLEYFFFGFIFKPLNHKKSGLNFWKLNFLLQCLNFSVQIPRNCLLSILINRQFRKVNYNFPQQILESQLHGQTKRFIELTDKRFNPFSNNNIPSNHQQQKNRRI